MSLFTPFACSARCMFGARATFCQPQFVLPKKHAIFGLHARFKSDKTHPSRPNPAASARRSATSDNSTKQGKPDIVVGSAKKLHRFRTPCTNVVNRPSPVEMSKQLKHRTHILVMMLLNLGLKSKSSRKVARMFRRSIALC